MIDKILEFSVRQRVLVLMGALALLFAGLWSAMKLPMDAIPDITGVQVQVNTTVPALAPDDVEKLVTMPLEMARGISSRSGRPSSATNSIPMRRKCSRCSRTADNCSIARYSKLMNERRPSISFATWWDAVSARAMPMRSTSSLLKNPLATEGT